MGCPSKGTQVQKRNNKIVTNVWLLIVICLFCLSGVSRAQQSSKADDDDFGKEIVTKSSTDQASQNIQVAHGTSVSANGQSPYSQQQQERKQQLAQQYPPEKLNVEIFSITPESGPTSGETRVTVRGGPFEDMYLLYPEPKCRFGRSDRVVHATYTSCQEEIPRQDSFQGKHANRTAYCLQCESSPPSDYAEIVNLQVSLTGDFSDSDDSEPFRYYNPTEVIAIYPRYGPKDGGTFVQVWGDNFLNFDQDTRCNFGSKSVVAHYISPTYMTCLSPPSDVVGKAIPFSVSLNQQQNSLQHVDYWYYDQPQTDLLVPNYGPDNGGNTIELRGSAYFPFKEFPTEINNSNDTFCWFTGVGRVPMKVENSSRAYCEAPPNLENKEVTYVEVSLNNVDWTDDNVPYFYYKPPRLTDVQPREGPTKGGTHVMVYGTEFKHDRKIICIFGNKKTYGKFISFSQVECISPKVPTPGIVSLSITYEGEGDKFKSEEVDYLYYETPVVQKLEPECGPITGGTQISVHGNNFIDIGFNKVKCVFNDTLLMNATIVNSQTIVCTTPKLTNRQASLESEHMFFKVSVTLNGREMTEEVVKFKYYPKPWILGISDSNLGPTSGGTTSNLQTLGFGHPNICKPTIRYGAIEVIPKISNDTHLTSISPAVKVPGAVTLQPSGNGQNFASDFTLHFRDIENTFTYHQGMYVDAIDPKQGPSQGGTKISVQGAGFKQFKYDNGTIMDDKPLWVKFVNAQNGAQIGDIQMALDLQEQDFYLNTPKAAPETKANLQFSFNKQDWQTVLVPGRSYAFSFYDGAVPTSIEPHFGPVKNPKNEYAIISGNNFACAPGDDECSGLVVRFGHESNGTIVPGKLQSSTQIKVLIPHYTKPDVLNVAISFNKQDYSTAILTYGYFDPYLLQIKPSLIGTDGKTVLQIKGFGFVQSDPKEIKAKFTTLNGADLSCNGVTPCIVPAQFISKHELHATAPANATLKYAANETNNGETAHIPENEPIVVEAAVYNNEFTENKLTVKYFRTPNYISISRDSIPANLRTSIYIDTDFYWNEPNEYAYFLKHANFTCKYTIGDETVVKLGRMETKVAGGMYANNNAGDDSSYPSMVSCESPNNMHNIGEGKLEISTNGGADYSDKHFQFTITEIVDVFRIAPKCGPTQGNTQVRLYGSGFTTENPSEQIFSLFGTVAVEALERDLVEQETWSQQAYLSSMHLTKTDLRHYSHQEYEMKDQQQVSIVTVNSPQVPEVDKTLGGPVYLSIGQQFGQTSHNSSSSEISSDARWSFSDSFVEFYYYQQPVVQKVEPTSGQTTGGTPLEISGIWFDLKPEYGLVPHCKIGDKVVRATYSSTVRIVCETPPSDNFLESQDISVSLNGVDFIKTDFTFTYYQDPSIDKIFPTSGPNTGGTEVYLFGSNFTNIQDANSCKCRFRLVDVSPNSQKSLKDRGYVVKTIPAQFINTTAMFCASPSGFIGGDKVRIALTFNGKDYSEETEASAYIYYNINGAFPHSGPLDATMKDVIMISGNGFKTDSKYLCSLNRTLVEPIEVTSTMIKCPMSFPGRDASQVGSVPFGFEMDGSWTRFGEFYYYKQITLDEVTPLSGPAVGNGLIYLYGLNFREDFPNSELACKVGNSVGVAELIAPGTMRCVIYEMETVAQGYGLPVKVALNSYSWVGGLATASSRLDDDDLYEGRQLAVSANDYMSDGKQVPEELETSQEILYVPYSVTELQPASGPIAGFTEITVTGSGFQTQLQNKFKCRFGTDEDYSITDAQVMDYNKLVCRSPALFVPQNLASTDFSINFGISANDEEYLPWTKDTQRFNYYTPTALAYAVPDEVEIGTLAEIYVFATEGSYFTQPVPTGAAGGTGLTCAFDYLGKSLGMYVNETTVLCMPPNFAGTPADYYREQVIVTVSMNGQDFNEELSEAQITFVGTGSNPIIMHFIIGSILLALLVLAALSLFMSVKDYKVVKDGPKKQLEPHTYTLRWSEGTVPKASLSMQSAGYNNNSPGRAGSVRDYGPSAGSMYYPSNNPR